MFCSNKLDMPHKWGRKEANQGYKTGEEKWVSAVVGPIQPRQQAERGGCFRLCDTAHIKKGQPPLPYFHFSSIPSRPPPLYVSLFHLSSRGCVPMSYMAKCSKGKRSKSQKGRKVRNFKLYRDRPTVGRYISLSELPYRLKATEFSLVSTAREYSFFQDRLI
jgi:hypothetical protein